MIRILFLISTLLLFAFVIPATASENILHSYSFDKKKASKEWSARKTFVINENRTLGLFNNRNKRYKPAAVLEIGNLPRDRELELRFDIIFVGSWDSEGKLADRFTVSIVDGPVLLDLTEFPCTLVDNDDNQPVGNNGFVKVGERLRPYWIKPVSLTIPAKSLEHESVKIEFRGYLTGRKTEFWALDNVKLLSTD